MRRTVGGFERKKLHTGLRVLAQSRAELPSASAAAVYARGSVYVVISEPRSEPFSNVIPSCNKVHTIAS